MLTREIAAGLEQWSTRVADARRRVLEAGPAERDTRIRYAGQCRREAFKYLAMTCGSLRGWPGSDQVGERAIVAAHRILLTQEGPEIRKVLPLVTNAAQQRRIPAPHLAEVTDALCVAERRPQIYGTAGSYPIADEARADTLRAALGLPPLAPPPPLAPVSDTAGPRRRKEPLPAELALLDGLLVDLPAGVRPARGGRRAVDSADAVWGCAYCGGPARPGAAEREIRGRVWRVCAACEACADTPDERLLDLLVTKGGIPEGTARATSYLARQQGWRLPLRHEQTGTRPHHRARPRWSHIPDTAVAKLTAFAEQRRPAVTPSVMPARRYLPAGPPHPELLTSPKALALLALFPGRPLTAKQVGQALQLAPATIEGHGLVITTVGDLQAVFAEPPGWLLDRHRAIVAHRTANRTRQRTGAALQEAPAVRVEAPHRPAGRTGPPHPGLLISAKAERMLGRPHDEALEPSQVAKALQIADRASVTTSLDVRTVGDLVAVFHDPPEWLVASHLKLAGEREADRARRADARPADSF